MIYKHRKEKISYTSERFGLSRIVKVEVVRDWTWKQLRSEAMNLSTEVRQYPATNEFFVFLMLTKKNSTDQFEFYKIALQSCENMGPQT